MQKKVSWLFTTPYYWKELTLKQFLHEIDRTRISQTTDSPPCYRPSATGKQKSHPKVRVSMGLTVRRKTAKNLAVRRKNERILAVSRKKN